MSLAAIQDNLLKTSLVQQTQSRSEDVSRGQEIGMQADLKEQSRQEDQVVLRSRETSETGVRDEEKDRRRREREKEEEDGEQMRREEFDEGEEDNGPRARMRTINIII